MSTGTNITVPFEELEGSPHISYEDASGFSAERMFAVDWSNWQVFILNLYGLYQVPGPGQAAFIEGPAGFPGIPQALPVSFTVEPMDPSSPQPQTGMTLTNFVNTYDQAKISVQYKMQFGQSGDRQNQPSVPGGWLTYDGDLGMDVETLPGRYWYYSNSTTTPKQKIPGDQNATRKVPTENFTLTWHRCLEPPFNAIRDARGTINQFQFLDHAPGTVLFTGLKTSRSFQFGDTDLWTLTYNFEVKENKLMVGSPPMLVYAGWNQIYADQIPAGQPANSFWQPIQDIGGNPPYFVADFGPIFGYAPIGGD